MDDIKYEIRIQQMVSDDLRVLSHLNIALGFPFFTAQYIFIVEPFSFWHHSDLFLLRHHWSYFYYDITRAFLLWHHWSYFYFDIAGAIFTLTSLELFSLWHHLFFELTCLLQWHCCSMKGLGKNSDEKKTSKHNRFGFKLWISAREVSKKGGSDEEEDTSKVLWENWWRPCPLCLLDFAWVQWWETCRNKIWDNFEILLREGVKKKNTVLVVFYY